MAKQYTLGKRQRLKSRKLIDELFSKGRYMMVFPYRVCYVFKQADAGTTESKLQCGVGAGTRHFKKAVDRNRIKRLSREAYRLQKNELEQKMKEHPCRLAVFLIYTGKELPAFDFVKEKLAVILHKLLIVADENHSPAT